MKHNTSSLFKLLLTLALIVAALLPQRAEAASSSLSGSPVHIEPDLDLMVEEFKKRGVVVE